MKRVLCPTLVMARSTSASTSLCVPIGLVDELRLDAPMNAISCPYLSMSLGMSLVELMTPLPYVHAHVDHVRNERLAEAVGMVDDQFHPMVLVVSVDRLVRLEEELFEHLGRQEGGYLRPPVVMVEQGVRLDVLEVGVRQTQLPTDDLVYEGVHLFRFLVEVHQRLGDLAQVVQPFEDARHDGAANELLVPVDGFGPGGKGLPKGRVVGIAGNLHLVPPCAHVGDDAVLQVVHGEKSRLPFDSLLVAPPCVDEVAVRRQVAPVAQGACHHHGESLVLVDIAVGVAPVDALQQVLALRKHGIDSLS